MFLSVDAALTLRSRAQRVTCDGALRTSFLLTSLFTAACASVRGRDAALLLAAITVLGAVAGTAVGRAVGTAVGTAVGRAVRPALDAAVRTAVGTAVDTAIGAGPWAHSLVGRWAGWCTGCDARALVRCKLLQAAGAAFLLPAAPHRDRGVPAPARLRGEPRLGRSTCCGQKKSRPRPALDY